MRSVDHALCDLAARLQAAAPIVVETVVARQRGEPPTEACSPTPTADAGVRAATASMVQAICSGLANGRRAPSHPPPGAVEQIAVAAAEGVPWTTVARTYAIAHAVVWEHLIAEAEGADLDVHRRSAVLQLVSRYLFTFVDHVTRDLGEVYTAEHERLLHSGDRRKARLVHDVLAGLPVAEEQLGYDLRGQHLGVIAWGPQRRDAVTELRRVSGLSALTLPGPGDVLWAWLGGRPWITEGAARAVRAALPPTGTQVALGSVGTDVEGFRTTHAQAMEAQRVALHNHGSLTSYDEVALESLVLQDVQLARAFALRELGPLAGGDARSAVLRETLRAYFAAGQNAAAAAAMLRIHERTVGYRLQSAADRIGRPVVARRDELVVALRVLAVLDPVPALRPVAVAAA